MLLNLFLKIKNQKSKGFSLIELSIVLLVLGFLVSGVLVGRTIIQKAKVQSIINEMISFQKNYQLFINTYQSVPGKMTYEACTKEGIFNDVAKICGVVSTGGNVPVGTSVMTWSSREECSDCTWLNGGANVGRKGDAVLTTISESVSAIRFMAAAGMLSFSTKNVVFGAANGQDQVFDSSGSNGSYPSWFPAFSADRSLFLIPSGVSSSTVNSTNRFQTFRSPWLGTGALSHFVDKNFLILLGSAVRTAAMNTITAQNLDIKIDDGLPYSGNFVIAKANASSTADGIGSTAPGSCTGQGLLTPLTIGVQVYTRNNNNENGEAAHCIPAFLLDQ